MTLLMWADIETTGLDPRADAILELAVTFAYLELPWTPISGSDSWVFHYPSPSGDPIVREMHTKNGLWECCAVSTTILADAEQELLQVLLPKFRREEDDVVLAGSSVHFDRSFLCHHMPELGKRLSHRVFDVSTLKMLARGRFGMPKAEHGELPHRALADVVASMRGGEEAVKWIVRGAGPRYPAWT